MKNLKKLVTVIVLLSFSLNVFSYNRYNKYKVEEENHLAGFLVEYSFENFLSMGVIGNINKYMLSFQVGINLETPPGEEYTTINWDEHRDEIYEEGTKNEYTVSLGAGYELNKKSFFLVDMEIMTNYDYRARFDNSHILGSNGYYHTRKGRGVKFGVKPSISYKLHKYVWARASYSTNTGIGLGVIVKFL